MCRAATAAAGQGATVAPARAARTGMVSAGSVAARARRAGPSLSCACLLASSLRAACGGGAPSAARDRRPPTVEFRFCGVLHGCGEALAARYGPVAVNNERAARARAEALTDLLPLPRGARDVGSADVSATRIPHDLAPDSPEMIDAFRVWRAPGRPQAVIAWISSHPPRRAQGTGWGTSGTGGTITAWYRTFGFTAEAATMRSAEVNVAVAHASGGGSVLRVDGVVSWRLPRPAAERIPAGVRSLSLALFDRRRHATVVRTITSPRSIAHVLALVEALERPEEGGVCAGAAVPGGAPVVRARLLFRGPGGRPLARVEVIEGACGSEVRMSIDGLAEPALEEGERLAAALTALGGG
ncbi:MAG: hypothetical protein KGJ43_04240 [Acidobacteriota bacterium]|nr:hypothetical protein [Acidobacteriota bacterium]